MYPRVNFDAKFQPSNGPDTLLLPGLVTNLTKKGSSTKVYCSMGADKEPFLIGYADKIRVCGGRRTIVFIRTVSSFERTWVHTVYIENLKGVATFPNRPLCSWYTLRCHHLRLHPRI